MEKGYEEFVEKLRRALIDATGFPEEKFCFEEKGGRYTKTGDRLFVECDADETAREVCGIYTREMYARYQKDASMEELVQEITNEITRVREAGFFQSTKKLADYAKVKEHLFIRLLNFEKNKESLRWAVYRTVGDIALVLYMKVYEKDGLVTSVKIRREHILNWGCDWNQVFEEALFNTCFMFPPRIYRWEGLLYDEGYRGENFMEPGSNFRICRDSRGNCLSTTVRTNGAIAIFLPGVAERLSEMMEEDLYLVFTSVHEVMVHNCISVEPEELRKVLSDTIREATPEDDYLSSGVFYYSRKTGKFIPV